MKLVLYMQQHQVIDYQKGKIAIGRTKQYEYYPGAQVIVDLNENEVTAGAESDIFVVRPKAVKQEQTNEKAT